MKHILVGIIIVLLAQICVSQSRTHPLEPFTPTRIEWELVHARSLHAGYFAEMLVHVNCNARGDTIIVTVSYSPDRILRNSALQHLNNVVAAIRRHVVGIDITVTGSLQRY